MSHVPRNVLILTLAAALAGCAHQGTKHSSSEDGCNPVVGALIGGAIGAAIGGGNHTARGAAVGAGVGALACVAYNYKTQQTKSAEQVGGEYRARNHNQLPPVPMVTAYRTESTRATARGGDQVTVTSNIEVVPGRNEPLKELREEFSIVDPNGHERSKLSKTPAPSGSQGGAYVSNLQFTFPQGVPAGEYQVASRLFVNGQPAQTSTVRIQVAGSVGGRPLLAADATVR